jgi:hypothetical protein
MPLKMLNVKSFSVVLLYIILMNIVLHKLFIMVLPNDIWTNVVLLNDIWLKFHSDQSQFSEFSSANVDMFHIVLEVFC